MPNIMSVGQKIGTIVSGAYQIPSEWSGQLVVIEVDIPANENDAANSLWFYAEIADIEAGPFSEYGGFHWTGGGTGKDGTWNPGRSWRIKSSDVGRWVRGRMEIPVRMRCGIDIDLST